MKEYRTDVRWKPFKGDKILCVYRQPFKRRALIRVYLDRKNQESLQVLCSALGVRVSEVRKRLGLENRYVTIQYYCDFIRCVLVAKPSSPLNYTIKNVLWKRESNV